MNEYLEIIRPGTRVKLADGTIDGIVAAVQITNAVDGGFRTIYSTIWWNGRERKEVFCERFELEIDETSGTRLRVGFATNGAN